MFGKLAARYSGRRMPLIVIEQFDGFGIGTSLKGDAPYTVESEETFATREAADAALRAGRWTQRLE